jgi:hypothetical protein
MKKEALCMETFFGIRKITGKITLRVRFELTRCDAPLVSLSRTLPQPQDQRRRPLGYLSPNTLLSRNLLSLTIMPHKRSSS